MKKFLSLMLALMLVLSLAACGSGSTATEPQTATVAADGSVLGEGASVFTFSVTDDEGKEVTYEIHTDAATVGDALLALGLVEGTDSEWGLYVTTVNGVVADYDADQAYWAFYIDGEYAMTGVDATEVTPGAAYSFVYTKG